MIHCAQDFALFVTMQNCRAFRPIIKSCMHDFFERRQILEELVDAQRLTAAQFSNDFWYFGLHAGDSARNIASPCLMEEFSPWR